MELPFRELVDAAPDGLIVCDPQGQIVLVNAEAERMFGYERGELAHQSLDILIPDRARPQHGSHLARFMSQLRLRPMGIGMQLTGRRKDGNEIPVEISLSPIETDRGMLVTAGIRDVTERRKLERENRRANAYLVSAVDSVREAFALFDEQDRVVMVNSAARQLFASALSSSCSKRRPTTPVSCCAPSRWRAVLFIITTRSCSSNSANASWTDSTADVR